MVYPGSAKRQCRSGWLVYFFYAVYLAVAHVLYDRPGRLGCCKCCRKYACIKGGLGDGCFFVHPVRVFCIPAVGIVDEEAGAIFNSIDNRQ